MAWSRKERLVRGAGAFLDDVGAPGALHIAFVRSPHAHALIKGIAIRAAASLPGVAAIVTANDIAADLRALQCYCPVICRDGRPSRSAEWPILAANRACYIGDPVACVAANTRYEAEAAAQAVAVHYGVLPAFLDPNAAFETGRDPAALRARNLRERATSPVSLPTGQIVDCGQFLANQDLCLKRADRAGFTERRAASQAQGRLRGFGLANYVEANGSLGIAKLTTGGTPAEAASFAIDGDGSVTIWVGTQSSGQDHATSLARLAAARLGLDPAAITIREGDSDALPLGGGTGGSRSTLAGLHALEAVLARLETRANECCAAIWDVALAEVTMEAGVLRTRDASVGIRFADVARAHLYEFYTTADCHFEHGSFANGCHACEVEVDPDTGAVIVLRYTAVDDFGTVLDEASVRGQVQGGVTQGLGAALLEHFLYDPADGRPLATSFDSYLLPTAADCPALIWVDNGLPSRMTPLGVKACGESAISAATPAIINAVVDALRAFPDAHALDMPATPDAVLRVISPYKTAERAGP